MLNSKYFPIIWIINDNYGGQSEVPPWTMMKDRTAGIAYAKGSQMTLTWGPQKGRFFRIYLMAAQLQHALITFIFFSSIPFPPSESLPYPIFSFSLICFLSKFAHNVLFVPHLILHTPPPPSLPIRFICVAFTITINLLYPLSLN